MSTRCLSFWSLAQNVNTLYSKVKVSDVALCNWWPPQITPSVQQKVLSRLKRSNLDPAPASFLFREHGLHWIIDSLPTKQYSFSPKSKAD
ncbi:MAG TPA: hypothetical protein VHA33_29650 [Candidatus Angelobacter sp.]|nr:hypothetical protein [Candidatus Angelobacter sp.]